MANSFISSLYKPGQGVTSHSAVIQCEPTTFFSTTIATTTPLRKRPLMGSAETSVGRFYRWALIVWLFFGLVIFVIDSTTFNYNIRLFGIPSMVYYVAAGLDHVMLQISIVQNLISLFVIGTLVHCFMLVAIPSLIVEVFASLLTYAYLLSTVVLLLCYGVLHMRRIVFATNSSRNLALRAKSSDTPRSLQSPYSTPVPPHNASPALQANCHTNTTSGDTALTFETVLSSSNGPHFRSMIVDSNCDSNSNDNFNTTQC